jgi:hypothetical protein
LSKGRLGPLAAPVPGTGIASGFCLAIFGSEFIAARRPERTNDVEILG